MIFIVIGQSGSGKTTFARERFLNGKELEVYKDIVYCTRGGDLVALGKYGIGIRTEGTDTLPYNAKNDIKKQIKKLTESGSDILLEGDRINNADIFEFIKSRNVETRLFLVTCSVRTSMERLRAAGSSITPRFVKATKTKSKRIYLGYAGIFHGTVINTENGGAHGHSHS